MRIAILSRYQRKNNRGVERFVEDLVSMLDKEFDISVFSGEDSDSLSKVIFGKFDVVMPMNGRLQALKVSMGRPMGKYKLVIGGHSGQGKDDLWNLNMVRPDVFIALTDAMKKWATKNSLGVKVVKIPNGIDTKKFTLVGRKMQFDLEKPVVLSVGSLIWYKHHERVIRAVAELEKGSLVIIGQGEDKEKLMKLGKELLGGRFKILRVEMEDMPDAYRGADLFTLPSWDREAFGLVYLEALASGLPVVAPDDLSRREIIGDGGIFVNVSNHEKYTDAIKKALNKKWGGEMRKQAEKFSWDKIAKQYKELFESLNE